MSVCAVVLCKDEADIIHDTLMHLLGEVDHVIVSDNGSTDGTVEIVEEMQGQDLTLIHDREVGYWQEKKTTALAQLALGFGHAWVIPNDADEVWYSPDGRTLSEYLGGVPPDVQIVSAQLFNHLPTLTDPCDAPTVFDRIRWRQRAHAPLPKVCARLRPDLVIHAGNHSASTSGTALTAAGLVVRHFSWRSEQQYLRKIRNGEAAYAATDLPVSTGAHWRAFVGKPDEAIIGHYHQWFVSSNPYDDETLILDPAPFRRWPEVDVRRKSGSPAHPPEPEWLEERRP